MRIPKHLLLLGLWISLTYLLIMQIWAIWPFTIDDMYISLRYAKNLSNGNGLVWNIGEPPVEGYSNFLMVLFASLSLLLKLDPVICLKLLGILGLILVCGFTYLVSRLWFNSIHSSLPVLVLLYYKGQIIWTVSGLETTLYQALLCGSMFCLCRGLGYQNFPNVRNGINSRWFLLAGFLLSIASITRPEAPIIVGMWFLVLIYDLHKEPKIGYVRAIGCFFISYLSLTLPYEIWRLFYYGYMFPNPVYCKGIAEQVFGKLDLDFLRLSWPFFLLSSIAIFCAKDRRHIFLWLPSLIYLVLLINADPIVAFDNRLFLPAFVLILPLAFVGAREILNFMNIKHACLFSVLFIIISLGIIPSMTLSEYRYFSKGAIQGEFLRQNVIDWININVKPSDSVVLADSGMIPYYNNARFIDSYCLNNLEMAHQYPVNRRYFLFCQNIIKKEPRFFVLTSAVEQGKIIYTPIDLCLKNELNQHKVYQLVNLFSSTDIDSTYRYEIYEKRNKTTL